MYHPELQSDESGKTAQRHCLFVSVAIQARYSGTVDLAGQSR